MFESIYSLDNFSPEECLYFCLKSPSVLKARLKADNILPFQGLYMFIFR